MDKTKETTKETTNIDIKIETMDIICKYCQTILINEEGYINHLEHFKHFICKYCEKDFFLAEELYSHFIKEHSKNSVNKQFTCEKCGAKFGYLRNLKRHMKNKGH